MNRRELLRASALGLAAVAATREATASALASSITQSGVDWDELARAYDLAPEILYLNHASIGTIPRAIASARHRYLDLCETNPWLYIWGGAWEKERQDTRRRAAALMRCDADEVAITHNNTEGINVLAQGLPLGPGDEVLFSSMNHPGASVCWQQQAARRGFKVRRFEFPVAEADSMSADDITAIYREQVRDATRVLVFPHVDNIIGFRYPLRQMASMAHELGVEFVVVDAAQAVGMIPVDVGASGVDFYATSPHKWLQAPKGTGLLYLRKAMQERVQPMWTTWGQARWKGTVRVFEDYGTRGMPEVLALGDALRFHDELGERRKHARLRDLWEHTRALVDATPRIRWRSPRDWKSSSSLYAVEVGGVNAPEAGQRLYAQHGIVLRAFGGAELNTFRLSPNVMTSKKQIERVVRIAAAL